jgi:hypothetical protein
MTTDEGSQRPIDRGLHALAIPIVHEGSDHGIILLHLYQVVLGIVGEIIYVRTDHPPGLAAIGIVLVSVTPGAGDRMELPLIP